MRDYKRGFTIIELLTVLAIIGILAGLIMTAGFEAKKRALVAKTKAAISGVETALGMFQSDIGNYPSAGNANMITCLTSSSGCLVGTAGTPMTTSQAASWSGPYMHFQTNEISSGAFSDPWGSPYIYRAGTDHGTGANYTDNYMDIYSFGPDKTDNNGAGDDIANWRR